MLPVPLSRALRSLPIFPLPRVTLFPHTLLPLHVFEPRYRALVRDVLDGHRLVGVPMLKEDGEPGPAGDPAVEPVFGVGRLVRHEGLPDGRSHVVLLGLARARVLRELQADQPYRVVEAELVDIHRGCTPRSPGLDRALNEVHLRVRQLTRDDLRPDIERLLAADRDPSEQVDVLAHMCLRDPAERQRFLSCTSIEDRADALLAALAELVADRPGGAPVAEG
jgi:Lon protease-like protein